jgi:hypothetical protein
LFDIRLNLCWISNIFFRIMENSTDKTLKDEITSLFFDIKKYIEYRYQYAKLDIFEKIILITRLLAVIVFATALFLFFILFLSISVALFFGKILHDNSLGFLLVAGIYFFLALILFLLRKYIITKPLTNYLIKILFHNKKKSKNED